MGEALRLGRRRTAAQAAQGSGNTQPPLVAGRERMVGAGSSEAAAASHASMYGLGGLKGRKIDSWMSTPRARRADRAGA